MSDKRILVLGKLQNGQRFRPSDWIERLAGCAASFERNQRLTWHDCLRPIYIDNDKCLSVDTELETINPKLWNFVINFATTNNLQIRESHSDPTFASDDLDEHAAA